jgi:hypothetical protein
MTTPHRQRIPTDRPPAMSPGPHERDGAPRPGVEPVVGQCRGDDVEDRGLPAAGSVRVWRPRPAKPEELDDARTVLVVHRLDPRTGRCAACAADCPCPPALDAGRVLAQAGAWNSVPFTSHTGRQGDQAPAMAQAGWVARLVRCLPWTAAAE